MTPQEIIDGKKAIAEFMNFQPLPNNHYHCVLPNVDTILPPQYMKFDSSWDWLMSVVEKISKLDEVFYFSILYGKSSDIIVKNLADSFFTSINYSDENTLDCVFKSVIAFIKWFNEIK